MRRLRRGGRPAQRRVILDSRGARCGSRAAMLAVRGALAVSGDSVWRLESWPGAPEHRSAQSARVDAYGVPVLLRQPACSPQATMSRCVRRSNRAASCWRSEWRAARAPSRSSSCTSLAVRPRCRRVATATVPSSPVSTAIGTDTTAQVPSGSSATRKSDSGPAPHPKTAGHQHVRADELRPPAAGLDHARAGRHRVVHHDGHALNSEHAEHVLGEPADQLTGRTDVGLRRPDPFRAAASSARTATLLRTHEPPPRRTQVMVDNGTPFDADGPGHPRRRHTRSSTTGSLMLGRAERATLIPHQAVSLTSGACQPRETRPFLTAHSSTSNYFHRAGVLHLETARVVGERILRGMSARAASPCTSGAGT